MAEDNTGTPLEVGIAIAGGGLGGLTLAVGLLERGFDAHIFEAAEELRTGSGTIIGVAANGQAALEGLKPGLEQMLRDNGSVTDDVISYVMRDGELVERIQRQFPGNFCVIRWQSIQNELANMVPPERVHCGHRLSAYTGVEGGVNVTFDLVSARNGQHNYTHNDDSAASGERIVRAKLLVGADGIRSAVRKIMAGDSPRYAHHLNWNAIVPTEFLPGLEKDSIHRSEDEVTGLITFKVDAGHGYSFWQVRVRDTDGKLADALGPEWGGLGKPGVKQRALEPLEGVGEAYDAVRSAIESTPEADIFERKLMVHGPLATWLDLDGRVALLGDAAHAMHPGPGEGARQAFEDAHQMCVTLVDAGAQDLEPEAVRRATRRYELLRKSRCEKVQAFSLESSGLPLEERVSAEYREFTRAQKVERYLEFRDWMYRYPELPLGDPNSRYFKPPEGVEV